MVIENFELNIENFRLLNSLNNPFFDTFFLYFSYLGSGFVLIPVVILTYFLRREKLKFLLLAILLETVSVIFLKTFFNQPRPATLLEDAHLLVPLYWRSFPSGDTAMAFTIATVLSKGEKRILKIILFVYASLIGYGRIYLGVHFPLDVFVGALIGILSRIFCYKILKGGKYERN